MYNTAMMNRFTKYRIFKSMYHTISDSKLEMAKKF